LLRIINANGIIKGWATNCSTVRLRKDVAVAFVGVSVSVAC
jgi:hypothetical protein